MIKAMETAHGVNRINRNLANFAGTSLPRHLPKTTDTWRCPERFLNFRLIHQRHIRKLVFIAADEGIGRMLGMLRYLQETHDHRPAAVFYGGCASEDIALQEELDQMPRHIKVIRIQEADTRNWTDCVASGIAEVCSRDFLAEAHFFLSGPEQMAEQVRLTLFNLGVRERRIYAECCESTSKAAYAE